MRGDLVGVQCLSAAVIEHMRGWRRDECDDVIRDRAVMHVEVTRVDVDGMVGIPETDPVLHRALRYSRRHSRIRGPSFPSTGSVSGSGTRAMRFTASVFFSGSSARIRSHSWPGG